MTELSREELFSKKFKYIDKFKNGALFIHPTDTIYGLGCNARDETAVNKIRILKNRHTQPFAVIAPSKNWIRMNCELPKDQEKYLEKLPGAYTLILKLKNKDAISENVNKGLDTIGVRMPDHWFQDFVALLNIPVVSTSVNKTGQEYMTSLFDLNSHIKRRVDYIIYEGKIEGKPSTLIRLDKEKVEFKER